MCACASGMLRRHLRLKHTQIFQISNLKLLTKKTCLFRFAHSNQLTLRGFSIKATFFFSLWQTGTSCLYQCYFHLHQRFIKSSMATDWLVKNSKKLPWIFSEKNQNPILYLLLAAQFPPFNDPFATIQSAEGFCPLLRKHDVNTVHSNWDGV